MAKIKVRLKPSMSKTQIRNELNKAARKIERQVTAEVKRILK